MTRPSPATLRRRGRELRAFQRTQWTGRWYTRGFAGERPIGTGAVFGEPQPWNILAGVPDRAQARRLVAAIRRFLSGVGAPAAAARPRADRVLDVARARRPRGHRARRRAGHRRRERGLRGRRLVRDQRLAHVGARRARRRRAARGCVRAGRARAQHARGACRGVPAALERNRVGGRRVQLLVTRRTRAHAASGSTTPTRGRSCISPRGRSTRPRAWPASRPRRTATASTRRFRCGGSRCGSRTSASRCGPGGCAGTSARCAAARSEIEVALRGRGLAGVRVDGRRVAHTRRGRVVRFRMSTRAGRASDFTVLLR